MGGRVDGADHMSQIVNIASVMGFTLAANRVPIAPE